MSLVITVYTREGIVVAADSRTTLNTTEQKVGSSVTQLAIGQTDSVYKLFLAKGNVAIATYGDADIRGVPISGYVETFMSTELATAKPPDEVGPLLLKYFRGMPHVPKTFFKVAGYKEQEQHVWVVNVAAGSVDRVNVPSDQGAYWGGEIDVLSRLIQSVAEKKGAGQYVDLPWFAIPWQFFTLQDAIDFVRYGIRSTIESMRFQMRPKTVGGPVDILVIKPSGATWISRKELTAGPVN